MIFWVGRFKKSLFSAAISKLLKGKCWFWPGTVDLKSLILGPTRVKAALAKVLFKHYESLSVLLAPSILMPSLTLGNPTCLIVDAGYQETKVIPVFEGVPVLKVGSRMTRIQVTLKIWSLYLLRFSQGLASVGKIRVENFTSRNREDSVVAVDSRDQR